MIADHDGKEIIIIKHVMLWENIKGKTIASNLRDFSPNGNLRIAGSSSYIFLPKILSKKIHTGKTPIAKNSICKQKKCEKIPPPKI